MDKTKKELMLEKEIKGLQDQLYQKNELIGEVILKLNRADIILGRWLETYLFCEEPTPSHAIAYSVHGGKAGRQAKNSLKWYQEYEEITQLICIVADYLGDSMKELETVY